MTKRRTNVRLDEQAREDARAIMKEHGLGSVSAAIRFALREVTKEIERKRGLGRGTETDIPQQDA